MEEDLIEEFKENAKVHFEMDYGDNRSVKKSNKAVGRMFEIAQKLNENGQFEHFAALLSFQDQRINLWVAHILLERLDATGNTAEQALSVINEFADSDYIDSYGEKLWLEQWIFESKVASAQTRLFYKKSYLANFHIYESVKK